MPENPISATQPDGDTETGEFAFAKPVTETPRIKRRSLKAKSGGTSKPSDSTPQPDREPAPLSTPAAQTPRPSPEKNIETKTDSTVKTTPTAAVPSRVTTPVTTSSAPLSTPTSNGPKITSTALPSQPASTSAAAKVAPATAAAPKTSAPAEAPTTTSSTTARAASTPAAGPASSPHGTRPATLYYSSQPRKEKEAPAPMKTIPTASVPSSSSTTLPSSVTRPAAASGTTSSRPATAVDYRANVERQSREQKSVGNILSYVVYALIAFFVLSAGLAGYGAHIIFKQLSDQSVTVSDLDKKYADANKDLTAKLSTAQDALTQNQAQIARQQDLIMKQQEELNRLMSAATDDAAAIKAEKAARAQETANIRARVRDLENKTSIQKY